MDESWKYAEENMPEMNEEMLYGSNYMWYLEKSNKDRK